MSTAFLAAAVKVKIADKSNQRGKRPICPATSNISTRVSLARRAVSLLDRNGPPREYRAGRWTKVEYRRCSQQAWPQKFSVEGLSSRVGALRNDKMKPKTGELYDGCVANAAELLGHDISTTEQRWEPR